MASLPLIPRLIQNIQLPAKTLQGMNPMGICDPLDDSYLQN